MSAPHDDIGCAHARGGFTLVELVVVMAILGIVASIAAPRFGASMTRRRLDHCERRIIADFELARRHARAQSSSVTMRFDPDRNKYSILGLAGPDTGATNTVVELARPPYNAVVQSALFDTDATVVFDGYGIPDSPGTVVVGVAGVGRIIALGTDGLASAAQDIGGQVIEPGGSGIKIDLGDTGGLAIQ